jgi:hypothetical protein
MYLVFEFVLGMAFFMVDYRFPSFHSWYRSGFGYYTCLPCRVGGAPTGMDSLRRGLDTLYALRITTETLVPPKPKAFTIAVGTVCSRAVLGT